MGQLFPFWQSTLASASFPLDGHKKRCEKTSLFRELNSLFKSCKGCLKRISLRNFTTPTLQPRSCPIRLFFISQAERTPQRNTILTIDDAKKTTLTWFQSKPPKFFRKGLECWKHRLVKCINLDGGYVEKQQLKFVFKCFKFFKNLIAKLFNFSYLSDCKPRLTLFLLSFCAAYFQGRLTIFFIAALQ